MRGTREGREAEDTRDGEREKEKKKRNGEKEREGEIEIALFYRTAGNEREARLGEGTVKLWRMCTRHHQGGLDSAKTCFLGSISLYHRRRANAMYRRTVARYAQEKTSP